MLTEEEFLEELLITMLVDLGYCLDDPDEAEVFEEDGEEG